MSQLRVFEFAKETGIETLALMDKLRAWKIPVKSHMAELDADTLALIRNKLKEESSPKKDESTKKVARKKVAAPEDEEVTKPVVKSAPKAAPKAPPKTTTTKSNAAAKAAVAKTEESAKTAVKRVVRRKAQIEEEAERVALALAEKEAAEKEAQALREAAEKEAQALKEAAEKEAQALREAKALSAATSSSGGSVNLSASTDIAPADTTKRIVKKTVVVAPQPTPKSRPTNIVGRMDLSRVTPPPRPQFGGGGGRPGGPSGGGAGGGRPGGGFSSNNTTARPLRSGFVATQIQPDFAIPNMLEDRRSKEKSKKAKTTNITETVSPKELLSEQESFIKTDYRKREVVFQPKKKNNILNREALKTQITTPSAKKRVIKIDNTMKVADLASLMSIKVAQLTTVLIKEGITATPNTDLDFDTIALIAPTFNYEAENIHKSVTDMLEEGGFTDVDSEASPRSAIVTVMGHVDHGKTSLLDAIRKTDVAAGEAGGITQHIGAYRVKLEDGHQLTFIDTPGHEAFTAMRARGAKVTDIAIIVVAADDGVMPQTAEAINHAKAAGVPIIIAVNKIDRPGANLEKIKQQMTEFELVPEEWGGQTVFCPVSAIKKQGIKELLEAIQLQAEMMELKANPNRSAKGTVIESRVEKGRGVVATVLVQEGTLKIGNIMVAGSTYGRVKAMLDERAKQHKEAGPGVPVEVLGLNATPVAGDSFYVVESEDTVKDVVDKLAGEQKKSVQPNSKMSLEELFSKVQRGDVKELLIILKTDVAGSSEAIKQMLDKQISEKVKTRVIHSAVGAITESDVLLASTSNAIIIGFNVKPDAKVKEIGKAKRVDIRNYSIIYELMDDMRLAMAGLLAPKTVETEQGVVEVRNIFAAKTGNIAGCMVLEGKVTRNSSVRVIRENKEIFKGKIGSLRRFKDSVKEVAAGFECGLTVENFEGLKLGDKLQTYIEESVAAEL